MNEIVELFETYGRLAYPVIFVWTFFEGETVVIFGGYASYHKVLNPTWLFLVAWWGTFLGDQLWYYLGRHFGERLIRRYPRLGRGVGHVSELMARYGVFFILSFRFVYGVRNVSSFAIGMIHYPRVKFFILNCLAAAVWSASFVGFGYAFGHLSEALLGRAAQSIGLAALGLFIIAVVLLLRRHNKRVEERERAKAAAVERVAADPLAADPLAADPLAADPLAEDDTA